MDGHGPGILPCENETQCQVSRKSKEGKTLTYKLHIIQQPLQARACGSGQKSSADRRPVDPPPIVEMRIFEGDTEAEQKDITFAMNGNYLLFAQLEQARKLAPVRGQPDHKGPPVLTGTPVAGMVYLERPTRAGYFIFPDLSVRHEGKYRIVFSLFEEVKDAKDEDCIADHEKPIGWRNGYISHRVEIRSQPFNVYSAKKFPGLAESTPLSRMVADQGCRVRIRRDVRMRRRDTKPGKDWDGYDDEGGKMR
ncbi:velvet factor-domain-containing protein, partial [Neohortaea acidophila]